MSLNREMIDVYSELGVGSHSLPDAGTGYQIIFPESFNVAFVAWVIPKAASFKLRVYCQCPHCGKNLPVGRLKQHSRTLHS